MNQHSVEPLNGIEIGEILHCQKIHDHLYSSGQPTPAQLALLAQAGVSTIINLALTDASNSLMNQSIHEDRMVLELGMNYIHLPLLWERPCATQAFLAIKLIHHLQDQLIWVHCAKNWRVASLMSLYRRFYMQMPPEQVEELLHEIWQPDETWTGLMHAVAMRLQAEQFST